MSEDRQVGTFFLDGLFFGVEVLQVQIVVGEGVAEVPLNAAAACHQVAPEVLATHLIVIGVFRVPLKTFLAGEFHASIFLEPDS